MAVTLDLAINYYLLENWLVCIRREAEGVFEYFEKWQQWSESVAEDDSNVIFKIELFVFRHCNIMSFCVIETEICSIIITCGL